MPFTILINGGQRRLTADGSLSLFQTLRQAKVMLPSACGGRGRCGLCKVRLNHGPDSFTELEAKKLTPEQRAAGWRLACQVQADRELDVELPPELVLARDVQTRVFSLEPLTHDIRRLRLEVAAGEPAPFRPGQYMQFNVPRLGRDGQPVTRTYSLASPRTDPRHMEFFIRFVPNGISTSWIFQELKVGDEIRLCGPFGDFHIRDGARPMLFIAGGSGLSPFASILDDLRRRRDPRPIRLFFGALTRADLYFLPELREYEQTLPDFRFTPALSAPEPGDAWDGETGLITDVVARHFPDLSGYQGYLCGSPGMIDACLAVLAANGLPADQVFYDKFG